MLGLTFKVWQTGFYLSGLPAWIETNTLNRLMYVSETFKV